MAQPLIVIGELVTLGLLAVAFFGHWCVFENSTPKFSIILDMLTIAIEYPQPSTEGLSGLAAAGGMAMDAYEGDHSWAMFGFDKTNSFEMLKDKACNPSTVKGTISKQVADLFASDWVCEKASLVGALSYVSVGFLGLTVLLAVAAMIHSLTGKLLKPGKLHVLPLWTAICVFLAVLCQAANGAVLKKLFDADYWFMPGFGMYLGIVAVFASFGTVCIASGSHEQPGLLDKGDCESYGANMQYENQEQGMYQDPYAVNQAPQQY